LFGSAFAVVGAIPLERERRSFFSKDPPPFPPVVLVGMVDQPVPTAVAVPMMPPQKTYSMPYSSPPAQMNYPQQPYPPPMNYYPPQQPYPLPSLMSYPTQQAMATYNPAAMPLQQANYMPSSQISQLSIPQQVGTGFVQQQWPTDQPQDLPFQPQQVPTPVAESIATDENQNVPVEHVEEITETTSSSQIN